MPIPCSILVGFGNTCILGFSIVYPCRDVHVNSVQKFWRTTAAVPCSCVRTSFVIWKLIFTACIFPFVIQKIKFVSDKIELIPINTKCIYHYWWMLLDFLQFFAPWLRFVQKSYMFCFRMVGHWTLVKNRRSVLACVRKFKCMNTMFSFSLLVDPTTWRIAVFTFNVYFVLWTGTILHQWTISRWTNNCCYQCEQSFCLTRNLWVWI